MAIIHCLTGKGRTATVLSALVCWLDIDAGQGNGDGGGGGDGRTATTMQVGGWVGSMVDRMRVNVNTNAHTIIDTPVHTHTHPETQQALQFVSEKMGLDPDKATIPSQRRYLEVRLLCFYVHSYHTYIYVGILCLPPSFAMFITTPPHNHKKSQIVLRSHAGGRQAPPRAPPPPPGHPQHHPALRGAPRAGRGAFT